MVSTNSATTNLAEIISSQRSTRAASAPDSSADSGESKLSRWAPAIVLLALAAVEILTFGPVLKNVGFYLDDWLALSYMQFCTSDYFGRIFQYMLTDPRVLIRPLEAVHFVTMFNLFGSAPGGYHIVNGVLEVGAAFFLFLSVRAFSRNSVVGFFAAVFLLLYPTHDCTHYWMVASSCNLSMLFSMSSLWCAIRFAQTSGKRFLVYSLALFGLSIANYEALMPLVSLNVLAYYMIANPQLKPNFPSVRNAVFLAAAYASLIVGFVFYQHKIIPIFGRGFTHYVVLKPSLMLETVANGVWTSSPFKVLPFAAQYISNVPAKLAAMEPVILTILALVIAGTTYVLYRSQNQAASVNQASSQSRERSGIAKLLFLGAFIVPTSYTIFGLNPEYAPTLTTIFARVNFGASVGLGLIFGVGVFWAVSKLNSWKLQSAVAALSLFVFSTFFMLTSWGLSEPWTKSWAVQKHVMDLVKLRKDSIRAGDSVMLINCPRYVLWAPVFDGVWDFQAMMKLALKDQFVQGGVVSERIEVNHDALRDVSMGSICGVYPYTRLFILQPDKNRFEQVRSAQEFVREVETNGLYFGLSKDAVKRWKQPI
jgi:hypothetical protein